MTMLNDVDIGSGSSASPRTTSASITTTTGTATSTPSPCGLQGQAVRRGTPDRSVTAEGAHAGAIEVLKDGLVGRGVLLDVPRTRGASVDRAGRARVPRRPRGGGARSGGEGGSGRHPSCSHRPRAAPGQGRPLGHRQVEGGSPPHRRRRSWLIGEWPRLARTATTTPLRAPPTGSPSPFTSSRSTPWACTCSTTSSSMRSARHCEEVGHWEFLFVTAPLRIVGGTGSPG